MSRLSKGARPVHRVHERPLPSGTGLSPGNAYAPPAKYGRFDAPPVGHPGRRRLAAHLLECIRDGCSFFSAAAITRLADDAAAEILRSEGLPELIPTRLQTEAERCADLLDALAEPAQLSLFTPARRAA